MEEEVASLKQQLEMAQQMAGSESVGVVGTNMLVVSSISMSTGGGGGVQQAKKPMPAQVTIVGSFVNHTGFTCWPLLGSKSFQENQNTTPDAIRVALQVTNPSKVKALETDFNWVLLR